MGGSLVAGTREVQPRLEGSAGSGLLNEPLTFLTTSK